MIEIIYFLILILSIFVLNKFFINKKLLLSQSGEKHQRFVDKDNVPLIGGIYFVITFLIIFFMLEKYLLSAAILLIFILGIFSDLKIMKSPKIRFFFQAILILFFIYLLELQIVETRLNFFDVILENKIFNFLFVLFCILILLNGTNFIDGLNGLVIGHFLMISFIFLKIGIFDQMNFSQLDKTLFFGIFFIIFIFNLFKKLYLGDNGSYTISLLFGVLLINFHQNYPQISPYFIILLLLYPCFENLFSIIRKFRFNRSPIYPDENHFHQVLFFYVKKKLNLSDLLSNNLSSSIILIFNTIIIFFGLKNIYSTNLQIFLIFIFVLVYIFLYIILFNFKYKTVVKK